MINIIWIFFISVGIITSFFTGKVEQVTEALFEYSKISVDILIGMVGTLTLWLGILKIAEKAGLIQSLSKLLRPILVRLFPEVPHDHPAMGNIVANIAANIFGLGNAATPFGIKAMQELQTLNPNKERATNAMVMFLAINTSSVTLISSSILAMRSAAESASPTITLGPTILSTTISTITAIIAALIFQRMKFFEKN
ncbi:MAG: nucleoside recognition domain-containing protein [Brevinemataceae bacterium]